MSHPENYGRFKQIFGVRDEQTHQGIVSMMRTEMGFLKLRYSKDAREAADELAFRDVAAVAFQHLSGAEEPEQGILEMQKAETLAKRAHQWVYIAHVWAHLIEY